jgi:hypothetical protein
LDSAVYLALIVLNSVGMNGHIVLGRSLRFIQQND